MTTEEKQELVKYLDSQFLMSLATSDGEGNLWSAPVYYLFDDDLNFYFLSNPRTLHCVNISKNPGVSFSIADSNQKLADNKIGLQVFGRCTKVSKIENLKLLLEMWKRLGKGSEGLSINDLKERKGSRFYKIRPTHIKFFNQILYSEEGSREYKL